MAGVFQNGHGPPASLSLFLSDSPLYSSILAAQSSASAAQNAASTTQTDSSTQTTSADSDDTGSLTTTIGLSSPTTIDGLSVSASPTGDATSLTSDNAAGTTTSASSQPTQQSSVFQSITTPTSAPVLPDSTFQTLPSPTITSSAVTSASASTSTAISSTATSVAASQPAQHTPALPSLTPSASPDSSWQALHNHEHKSAMSGGMIAAAVIVPLVAIAAIILLLLLFLRRRNRRRQEDHTPVADMRQKFSGNSIAPPPRSQPHIGTNPNNPTYFTGLDTESAHGSDRMRTSEEPPPPYMARTLTVCNPDPAPSIEEAPVPFLRINDTGPNSLSPFDDSEAVVAPAAATTHKRQQSEHSILTDLPSLAPVAARNGRPTSRKSNRHLNRPQVSRQASARSITSTLYSSDASVMEAEPASVSHAEPRMVRTSSHPIDRSPFADPDPEE